MSALTDRRGAGRPPLEPRRVPVVAEPDSSGRGPVVYRARSGISFQNLDTSERTPSSERPSSRGQDHGSAGALSPSGRHYSERSAPDTPPLSSKPPTPQRISALLRKHLLPRPRSSSGGRAEEEGDLRPAPTRRGLGRSDSDKTGSAPPRPPYRNSSLSRNDITRRSIRRSRSSASESARAQRGAGASPCSSAKSTPSAARHRAWRREENVSGASTSVSIGGEAAPAADTGHLTSSEAEVVDWRDDSTNRELERGSPRPPDRGRYDDTVHRPEPSPKTRRKLSVLKRLVQKSRSLGVSVRSEEFPKLDRAESGGSGVKSSPKSSRPNATVSPPEYDRAAENAQ
ncbi:serine/arginine repetitive matrix protein 1-like, partial [Amphibalanus amphitrite]|uniref:serine/arginine repetitive matrix protein 1-like n=1 Tax=Amphibalanus amphitrite TaxID=1232801 RepID=UPI001C9264AD